MFTVPHHTPLGSKSCAPRRERGTTVLCAALLAAALAANGLTAASENFKPFKMKTLEGRQTSLKDVLGKATLVVFFFPTCAFCNAAFPEIQRIHDTYRAQGLSTVWINIVPEQDRLIAHWRAKHGYTVPILLGGQSAQDTYKLTMTPTHYLLDAQGKVLAKHSGYTRGDEKELERQIQQALTP